MQTLKFYGDDGLYTNIAYLLSDQCGFTTKVAIFQDDDKSVFRDREEFRGSLLKQLEDVYKSLEFYNRTQARFDGLIRIDTRDYPQEAIREALLNAIVHRDYSFSGSNLINIYGNRVEFVSLGGLVPGIELDSIFLGVSQCRNPNLASVFYRLKLIESYGTGIEKIERAYKNSTRKPKFETARGVFRVTLPNINVSSNGFQNNNNQLDLINNASNHSENNLDKILKVVKENNFIKRETVENLLDIGKTQAAQILRSMVDQRLLRVVGKGKSTRYVLNETNQS